MSNHCEHGRPIRFGCMICKDKPVINSEHQIGILRNQVAELTNLVMGHLPYEKNLVMRVQDCEQFSIDYQADSAEILCRIERLESDPTTYSDIQEIHRYTGEQRLWLTKLEERIEKLEGYMEMK